MKSGKPYYGELIQILRIGEMLIYAFVNSAFAALKSYYFPHTSAFFGIGYFL